MMYEKDIEILSSCISLCGPPALATKDSSEVIRYENTSYSIPAEAPLLNITHGKHQFPFGMATSDAVHGNLPASFHLNFPQSRDSCSISYTLEYVFPIIAFRCTLSGPIEGQRDPPGLESKDHFRTKF